MTRTITAMFDSRSEAEAARARLTASSIDADRVRIIDQSTGAAGATTGTTGTSAGTGEGFWASLRDMFMPDEDRHAYGEGIQRGHFMLAAEVEESQADEACRILEDSNSVDFDQRTSDWRSQGWGGRYERGYEPNDVQSGAFGPIGDDDDRLANERTQMGATTGTAGATGAGLGGGLAGAGARGGMAGDRDRVIEEEHVPIVEEQLRVGKREVNRGGARVRSYVRETPVHEDVTLHSEHVSVERRPVNETLGRDALRDGDMFRDREIEMTEHSEEAVVGKEAVVREEVVVRKTGEDRVESIDDTVRRTEVDVDEGLTRGDGDRGALFGGRDRDRDNDGIRDDLERDRADRDRY
jgi:uncharacterized protein (TIGR02271 family)